MKTVDKRAVRFAVTDHLRDECRRTKQICQCESFVCHNCEQMTPNCNTFTIDQYWPSGTMVARTWICAEPRCMDWLNQALESVFDFNPLTTQAELAGASA